MAYTKLTSAFLNSSGFHLAIINFPHIKINIPIARRINNVKIESLANPNIASKKLVPVSQDVFAVRISFEELGIITDLSSS
jgi:hypothetical protein